MTSHANTRATEIPIATVAELADIANRVARLERYPVVERDGVVYLQVRDASS